MADQLYMKLGYIASSRTNLHWSSGIKDAHYSLHNFPGIYQNLCEHKKCSEVGCLFSKCNLQTNPSILVRDV